jgi:hypothetical protein
VRRLACLAALVLLTGCNLVITHKPMFAAADSAGAPGPRPGLWRMEIGGDKCEVDESRPLSAWPNCGGGMMLGAGTVSYFDHDGETPVWKTEPLVLAAGQPIMGQVRLSLSGDIKLTGDAYAYVGVRPTKLDEAGRFTRFEFWPVQCGPPPKDANKTFTEQPAAGVKVEPIIAGSELVKSLGPLCTIDDPVVMRRVAAQSEAWLPHVGVGHWVRDKAD